MSILEKSQIFDDLSTLRLDDTDLTAGVSEVLAHVAVRKPNRHEFFRVHPDEAYTLDTTVLIDKEDGGEAYLVTPSMRAALVGEARPVLLSTAITRQGSVLIWPVPLPSEDGRRNRWADTAHEAARLSKGHWVRLAADMSLGYYRIYRAEGDIPDPVWPDKPFPELLKLAFAKLVIDSPDHPIVRRLRGLS